MKAWGQWVFAVVLVFFSFDSGARTHSLRFANGNHLEIDPDYGVRFVSVQAAPLRSENWLVRGKLAYFRQTVDQTTSESGGQWSDSNRTDMAWVKDALGPSDSAEILQSSDRIYLISPDGDVVSLPLPGDVMTYGASRAAVDVFTPSADGNSGLLRLRIQTKNRTNAITSRLYWLSTLGERRVLLETVEKEIAAVSFDVSTRVAQIAYKDGTQQELNVDDFPDMLDDDLSSRPRAAVGNNLVPDDAGGKSKAEDVVKENMRSFREELRSSSYFPVPFPEEYFEAIRAALTSDQVASLVLIGNSGVGKSELLRAFVDRAMRGFYPEFARVDFVRIDGVDLDAGAKWTGVYSGRIKALIQHAKATGAVLVVDELTSLIGKGTHSGNLQFDALHELKSSIADGSVRVLACATKSGYSAVTLGQSELERRLPTFEIPAPEVSRIPSYLRSWLLAHHKVLFPELILQRIAGYVSQLGPGSLDTLPSAVQILDRFYSHMVRNMRKSPGRATLRDLNPFVARELKVHEAHLTPELRLSTLEEWSSTFREHISGYEELSKSLDVDSRISITNTMDRSLPQGLRVLAGPPGVGKTEVARSYARSRGLPFKRIALTTYGGFQGPEQLIVDIARALFDHPHTVFLFDEPDKAPANLQYGMLSILDSSVLEIDAQKLNSRSPPQALRLPLHLSYVFLGTNAGADWILSHPGASDSPELREAMVADHFLRELLNRMASIHVLNHAQSISEMINVLRTQLTKLLSDQGQRLGVQLTLSPDFQDALLHNVALDHFPRRQGYRPAIAQLKRTILGELSQRVLSEPDVFSLGSVFQKEPCREILLR